MKQDSDLFQEPSLSNVKYLKILIEVRKMSNVIDFKSYDFNHMSLTISSFKVFYLF